MRAIAERRSLAADLRSELSGEVRFSDGDRALYATDASNHRQVPIGVVIPRGVDDVLRTVEVCRAHDVPVLPRGGGTSLAGQCCNVAVVMDFSKYLRGIVELDPERRIARVQPGVVLDDLRNAAERHGLTFGPDPATHDRCTLGGMIGNNSCGVHSLMAGKTVDNVEELDVLTYDGLRLHVGATSDEELEAIASGSDRRAEIYRRLGDLRDRYADPIRERYPDIPRRVSGYNLDDLLPEKGFHVARSLVGTEGTCVTVLEATVRLVPSPLGRAVVVLGYRDAVVAAANVPRVLEHGPIGLEGFDATLVEDVRRQAQRTADLAALPEGGAWLIVEFGGQTREEAEDRVRKLTDDVAARRGRDRPTVATYEDRRDEQRVWAIREAGLGATARVPGRKDAWPGWEDSAVAPERLADYLRGLGALVGKHGYHAALYGHFGQGCVHTRLDFDLATAKGIARYRAFVEDAADLVVSLGGSLSGEHGDGQSRAELLPTMFGPELVEAFRAFKAIWDPAARMNPGKIVHPDPLDSNLRLGADYRPATPATVFAFPQDDHSFTRAALRCVGVGTCRSEAEGVMCPSYMATREEKHSTRGRAHLLFEMLRGDPLKHGWRNEAVRDALDLCLSCKGCKTDCPVNVDMATYKAEFLHHYYRGRLRPRSAYAMGLIPWAARVAAVAPGIANRATADPPSAGLVRRLGGIAPERTIPRFAPRTFVREFRTRGRRGAVGGSRGPVMLWPDTFTNHFRPRTAWAAVDVLESVGYRVFIPPRPLCCGRPLYDVGMLKLARRQLRQVLRTLAPAISRGVPLVGIEPSCTAVFRDELSNMLPDDEDAKRLSSQTHPLTELLAEHSEGWEPPRLSGTALVQAHCHHRAAMGFGTEEEVLRRTGLQVEVVDPGCCGMAGAFGFEAGHYDVSMACGERVLLPAVRSADQDTVIVADGFSCREQIEQATDRTTLHTAEVLAGALRARVAEARVEPETAEHRAAADATASARAEGGDR